MVDDRKIDQVTYSAMLNPQEIKGVLLNHNLMIQDIDKFEKENNDLNKEIQDLKQTLSNELSKEQPNIKEITDRIVKQELDAQKKKFD
jgi:hypothetical protein